MIACMLLWRCYMLLTFKCRYAFVSLTVGLLLSIHAAIVIVASERNSPSLFLLPSCLLRSIFICHESIQILHIKGRL